VIRIDHYVIAVSDWGTSNAFYRDVMRAEIIQEGGRTAYRFGDQQLNVHGPGVHVVEVAKDRVRPGNSDLCFVWDGAVDEAIAHLERHGVEIISGPVTRHGARGAGTSVYFRDPDGTLLEFITY
jgi:catechol 2,3-dioxygenase-like lactoylglutathione lyase family enzyme